MRATSKRWIVLGTVALVVLAAIGVAGTRHRPTPTRPIGTVLPTAKQASVGPATTILDRGGPIALSADGSTVVVGGSVFARSGRTYTQVQDLGATDAEVAVSANGAAVLLATEIWQRGSDGRYTHSPALAPIPGRYRHKGAISADGTVAVVDLVRAQKR